MSKSLVTNDYKVHTAIQLLESVSEEANNLYYMFVGNHTPMSGKKPSIPINSQSNTILDVYHNMIFGKKISTSDVILMIERNNYVSNTIYDMYDDVEDFSNNSYVCVNNGSYYHVFKCLFNNNGNESTYEPNIDDIDPNDELYITADNYIWEYAYTVTDTEVSKFGTTEYFPIKPNTEVESVSGGIYVIKVEDGGQGFDNYLTGSFRSDELRINSDYVYSIASANQASAITGFYNGCYIVITDGAASGKYAKISNYVVNSTVKQITLESPFTVAPALNSTWEIMPGVVIDGDGNQTVNSEARAIVNSVSNTIDRIEMLNIGQDYRYANAYVYHDSTVGVTTEAELRVIYAPIFGHCSNVYSEFNASRICFSGTFGNSYNDEHLIFSNDYRQIGILKDPKFKDVTFVLANTVGTFAADETVFKINPIRIYGSNVTVNATSNTITANDSVFDSAFSANDYIYIESDSAQQISTIYSVSNSSQLIMTSTGLFACNDTKIYLPEKSSNAYITSYTVGSMECSNVCGNFVDGDFIVGLRTGATAYINSVSRSATTKDFSTFIQMYKYNVTLNDTPFREDETVFMEELSVANGILHSVAESNSIMYLTNHRGTFNISNDVIGNSSGSSATITAKYYPEIEFGSGDILYIENLTPISRQNEQKEVFKIIFEY